MYAHAVRLSEAFDNNVAAAQFSVPCASERREQQKTYFTHQQQPSLGTGDTWPSSCSTLPPAGCLLTHSKTVPLLLLLLLLLLQR
jgi:hypothetical protein